MTHDFNATYDLYHAPILRYCLWKCRDKESSQDLMQETFLRYWIFLQNKKEVLHIRAFLYRIANNLIVDEVRKKKEFSLDEMREYLKATSLRFLSYDGMIRATGRPESDFSTSCFTGIYPIDIRERAKEIQY